MNDEWIICPSCRTRLNRVCPNCSRLVGLDWSLCAWCGKDFERREVAAAAAPAETLPVGVEATGRLPTPPVGAIPSSIQTSVRSSTRSPRGSTRSSAAGDPLPER